MNSEQLKEIWVLAGNAEISVFNCWHESLSGGDPEKMKQYFADFEKKLKQLNEMVERFHMDNENEVTSERVQP